MIHLKKENGFRMTIKIDLLHDVDITLYSYCLFNIILLFLTKGRINGIIGGEQYRLLFCFAQIKQLKSSYKNIEQFL